MTEESAERDLKEMEAEQVREVKEAREHKALLEGLLAHPGWDIVCKLLEAQIETRTSDVMASPLGGEKSLAKQEWLKGEASGLRLAKLMPNITLEVCEAVLRESGNDASSEPEFDEPGDDGDSGREFDPGRDDPGEPAG